MKCFYCKTKLSLDSNTDVCERCSFFEDDDFEDSSYDEDLQRDIDAIVNKTGVTPRRYVE